MKLKTAIDLRAESAFKVGDQVTVDGMMGRGMIVRVQGKRATVQFRSGEFVSRDFQYLHRLSDNTYKSQYSSLRAGEELVERETSIAIQKPKDAYIEKVGTQFCVRSRSYPDRNFGCFPSMEEAQDNLRYKR